MRSSKVLAVRSSLVPRLRADVWHNIPDFEMATHLSHPAIANEVFSPSVAVVSRSRWRIDALRRPRAFGSMVHIEGQHIDLDRDYGRGHHLPHRAQSRDGLRPA